VVERLTSVFANYFLTPRTAGEQQGCVRRAMYSEEGKHSTLIVWTKMKKAIPGDDPAKSRIQAKLPHIRNDPVPHRKPVFTDAD
jgi:hypothetical protein